MRSMLRLLATGLFLTSLFGPSTAGACPADVPCRERLADPVRRPVVKAEPEGPSVAELRVAAARAVAEAEQELLARQLDLFAVSDGTYATSEAKAAAESEAQRAYGVAKAAKVAAYDAYLALLNPSRPTASVEATVEVAPAAVETSMTTTTTTTVIMTSEVMPVESAPAMPKPIPRVKELPSSWNPPPILAPPAIPLDFYTDPIEVLRKHEPTRDEVLESASPGTTSEPPGTVDIIVWPTTFRPDVPDVPSLRDVPSDQQDATLP